MKYIEWNDIIARHFFNPENAGKEVLLYVNKDLIEELGRTHGCGYADFIQSIKAGPEWVSRAGICQKALQSYRDWRKRDRKFPPYIGYLACFVLAASTQMDVRADAYYPRLNLILGEEGDAPVRSFDKTAVLWEDLENWTIEDKSEEIGRFVFGIQGNMIWVGLPRFQSLISGEERKKLKGFFGEADFDPSDPPSQEILLKQILLHGDDIFQRTTRGILRSTDGDDLILKNKLLDFILDELEEWDGELIVNAEDAGQPNANIQSGLRLCMEIDPIANYAKFKLRIKSNRSFPEDPLKFEYPGNHIVICKESSLNWSNTIRYENGNEVDSAKIDWEEGLKIFDQENNWIARLKSANIRLFISGKNEGFSGWVETQKLERGIPFILIFKETLIEKIKSWGDVNCNKFDICSTDGIPDGWVLAEASHAANSCEGIDVLTLSTLARISLKGGAKVRGGNTYLNIAPPQIVLENCSGDETPVVKGIPLRRIDKESHLWELPEDISINQLLRIEAEISGKIIKKIIRLEEPKMASEYRAPYRNSRGEIIQDSPSQMPVICGVNVSRTRELPDTGFEFLAPSLKKSFFLLGLPGQIAKWPEEGFPTWTPQWAIEKINRKKWTVLYCRRSLNDSQHSEAGKPDRQLLKKWKELVWHRQKAVKAPAIPQVSRKWHEYVEGAKNV